MKLFYPWILFLSALLSGCAGFFKYPSAEAFSASCDISVREKNYAIAEKECELALLNNETQNNAKSKSQRLFNLGLIKQQLSKYSESELLFAESLRIEEFLASPHMVVGSRLIELSISLSEQGKWHEGTKYLERVLPFALQFTKVERARIGHLFMLYSKHLNLANQAALSKKFKNIASLIVDNDTYNFTSGR